jgi:hypothetical protein
MNTLSERNDRPKEWEIGLCAAMCREPLFCLFGLVCMPCANFVVRKEAFQQDFSKCVCALPLPLPLPL